MSGFESTLIMTVTLPVCITLVVMIAPLWFICANSKRPSRQASEPKPRREEEPALDLIDEIFTDRARK